MTNEGLKFRIRKLTFYLEFVLAMFIAIAVIIGMIDLVKYIILIFTTNPIDTYDIFQKFLGHVLLLVVGVELVIMLVYHSPSSVMEVLLYAIARKVLIGNQGMLDFFIGIIAIAAIFTIRRFLFTEEISIGSDSENVFGAAVSVKEINQLLKLDIPEEMGNTLGGVIINTAKQSERPIITGAEFQISKATICVLKMKEGLIEKVLIKIHK